MTITIKLFATLQQNRFDIKEIKHIPAVTIRQIIEQLGIPINEVAIIFVNGKHASLDQELQAGDTLSLFPPVGGG